MHRPRSTTPIRVAALALLLVASACSKKSKSTTPTTPAEPVPTVTETFSGSFGLGQSSVNPFTVTATGDVNLKVTDLEPLTTITVGMGIGTYDATLSPPCTLISEDTSVRVGDNLLSSGLVAGSYCVQLRDVGNIFPGQTVTYSVDVTHP
jgi:hypothetical protein